MSKARGLADLGNVYDDGALSNRNLFLNGDFSVWQRGTSGFSHNVYSADRWQEQTNTDDVLSVSRVEAPSSGEAGLPRQFTYMAKFALTAGTTVGLNDLRQKVENPKGLAGQTLTLSYYIKASSSCTINNRRIGWNGVTNAPPATYLPSLNVTTGWQRVENTFTLESSGTAVYASNANLDVILGLPINTTVDVYITGVQLELGDTATPFEHRSLGQELALCERYFTTATVHAQAPVAGFMYVPWYTTNTMRVTPTLTVNAAGVNVGAIPTADLVTNARGGLFQIQATPNGGGVTSRIYFLDAEL
jgi:hypothetical protein